MSNLKQPFTMTCHKLLDKMRPSVEDKYYFSSVYYFQCILTEHIYQNQVSGRFVITCQILHEQDKERLGPWVKAAYQTQPSDHVNLSSYLFSCPPHTHTPSLFPTFFSSICFAENTHPEVSVQRPSTVIIELPRN